jgi:hypothetical protein
VFDPGPKTTFQVFVIVAPLFQELTSKHKTLNSKDNIATKKKERRILKNLNKNVEFMTCALWLMLIFSWEAEIGRIMVEGQAGQQISMTPV